MGEGGITILFFRNKPKKHILKAVAFNYQKDFYKAVRCENCKTQYVMDVFGGWAVEWNFKLKDQWTIDEDDFTQALAKYRKLGSREWFQVDQQECKGDR